MKTRSRKQRARSGFTMVELVVVVAIMGLLASMAIPGYQRLVIASKKSEQAVVIRNIEEAIFSYLNEHDQQFQYSWGGGSWSFLSFNPPPPFTSQKKAFVPTAWGWNDFGYQPTGDLYYQYEAYGSVTPGFSYFFIVSVGDLDDNGIFAWHYKYWYRDSVGSWYPFWEFTIPNGEE